MRHDREPKAPAGAEDPPTAPPPAASSGHQVGYPRSGCRSSGHRPAPPSRPWIIGERVRLRKAHPCGSSDWRITGVGADIRLVCLGCGRRIELPREEFNRRVIQAKDTPPGR
jgi:hypothetical protein